MCAALRGYSDLVEFYLSKGADLALKNKREFTALHFAVASRFMGYMDTVKLLVQGGADLNSKVRVFPNDFRKRSVLKQAEAYIDGYWG